MRGSPRREIRPVEQRQPSSTLRLGGRIAKTDRDFGVRSEDRAGRPAPARVDGSTESAVHVVIAGRRGVARDDGVFLGRADAGQINAAAHASSALTAVAAGAADPPPLHRPDCR